MWIILINAEKKELKEKYKNISLSDGKVRGSVECFYYVYSYKSCPSCNCRNDKKVCVRCKNVAEPVDDFKYEIMIKIENDDDKYDQLIGFKRTIPSCGDIPTFSNATEDHLNEAFQGKRVVAEFTYNKNDCSKLVLSLEIED